MERTRVRSLGLLMAVSLVLCTGCTSIYMQNRCKDAMDIIELGITTSPVKNPGIAAQANFSNIFPIGGAWVCGWFTGIGARQVGTMELCDRSWGVLVWGSDDVRIGQFDPNDPHEAWVDDMARLKAMRRPLPTERPRYNTGFVRIPLEGNSPPPPTYWPCSGRKHVHLGWIGVLAGAHPFELLDFLFGWTTLDFMEDDVAGKPDLRE